MDAAAEGGCDEPLGRLPPDAGAGAVAGAAGVGPVGELTYGGGALHAR